MSAERLIWAGTVSPWRVTARETWDSTWLVRFTRSADGDRLDHLAAWLPDGRWDIRRWWPHSPVVPVALRRHVEQWLRDHPLQQEAR